MKNHKKVAAGAMAAICISLIALPSGAALAKSNAGNMSTMNKDNMNMQSGTGQENTTGRHAALDKRVMAQLNYCRQHFSSCKTATQNAAGVLVFPSVVKADLVIGGSGGNGALIRHGKIIGYYKIGAGSVGLQAGVQNASQIYVFPTEASLKPITEGSAWRVGATADVTVMSANANARGSTGNIQAFVFDAKGLHAGASVDAFDIWKTGTARPQNVG